MLGSCYTKLDAKFFEDAARLLPGKMVVGCSGVVIINHDLSWCANCNAIRFEISALPVGL